MLRSLLLIVSVVLLGLSGQATRAQVLAPAFLPATVEGNITNKDLSEVTVRLEILRSSPLGFSDGYTATVAADGSFRFDDVAPGNYRLIAETPFSRRAEFGSSAPEQPGTILQIKAGDHRKSLTLNLLPDPPAVCGRVTGGDDRPLRATVEAFTIAQTGDGWRAVAQEPSKVTGPDGRFLFSNLWPQGRYFLRVNGVWYPSTESFSAARLIEPMPNSRSRCTANIRVPRGRCRGSRVHGTIQSTLGKCGRSAGQILLRAVLSRS